MQLSRIQLPKRQVFSARPASKAAVIGRSAAVVCRAEARNGKEEPKAETKLSVSAMPRTCHFVHACYKMLMPCLLACKVWPGVHLPRPPRQCNRISTDVTAGRLRFQCGVVAFASAVAQQRGFDF